MPVENFLVLSGRCRGAFHPFRATAGNVKNSRKTGKFLPDEKKIAKPLFCHYSAPAFLSSTISNGQVSEWSNEHAWKVCVPQTGTEGSNPSLSAILFFLKPCKAFDFARFFHIVIAQYLSVFAKKYILGRIDFLRS